MDSRVCLIVTLVHHGSLLRCALRLEKWELPGDFIDYPMEYRDLIATFLPLHVRNAGPVVEIETIFALHDASKVVA